MADGESIQQPDRAMKVQSPSSAQSALPSVTVIFDKMIDYETVLTQMQFTNTALLPTDTS